MTLATPLIQFLRKTTEYRTLEFIPEDERFGSISSQFTLWFSTGLNVTASVIGAIAVTANGALVWSLLGLLIGQVIGAIILSFHALQGPALGVPQIISTRAQFGIKGTLFPAAMVCLMCIGLSASGSILAGQSFAAIFGITDSQSIVIFSVFILMLTIFGYRVIHTVARIAALLSVIAFAYMFWSLLNHHDIGLLLHDHDFSATGFWLAVSLSASWQLSFCPFVADYSRYLPRNSNPFKVFFATLGGSVLGAQIAMMFGVVTATLAGSHFAGHEMTYMVGLGSTGVIALMLYITIAIGKLVALTLNTYTSSICCLSLMDHGNKNKLSPGKRFFIALIIITISTALAISSQHDIMVNLTSLTTLILTCMTPWSIINLFDFYCNPRQPDYTGLTNQADINIFPSKYITYLAIYIVSILIQLPFISTSFYHGVLSNWITDVDISWMIGLAFPGIILVTIYNSRLKSLITPLSTPPYSHQSEIH